MPRMMHLEHGFDTVSDTDVEGMLRLGWTVFSNDDQKRLLAAKSQPVTMETPAPKRMGRPKRTEVPVVEVDNGNSPIAD